ncbi:hypothetical protein BDZ45DRAFT_681244 [Acephala macrosclerotiorum]|nr:hypothetical protein BDZ45DRAFT_681244 [Acephala macrosclerotiorum]
MVDKAPLSFLHVEERSVRFTRNGLIDDDEQPLTVSVPFLLACSDCAYEVLRVQGLRL